MNSGQRAVLDRLLAAAHNPHDLIKEKNNLFFLDSPGGYGKTFLLETLILELAGQGHIVVPTAWTGLAALNMPFGATASSRFHIPLDLDDTSTCDVKAQSALAKLLREATLIIWDECTMVIYNITHVWHALLCPLSFVQLACRYTGMHLTQSIVCCAM
jgi:ATP-dependent DNA helicase PIF1